MEQTKVLDHGYVGLVEHWGSDENIISAARMSTQKGFQGWGGRCDTCNGSGGTGEMPCTRCGGKGDNGVGDEKLLRYLYEHKHMTPFEMAGMTIEVQAPIFVFREWHRHRTQSYNEMSGRYTQLPDLTYLPSIERLMAAKQGTKNKQGSADGFSEGEALGLRTALQDSYEESRCLYEGLVNAGVAKEVARLVLPVAQYSKMRASANLRNWLGFLTLRMDPAAQAEIREYANVVAGLVKQLFPRTFELFREGRS